MSFETTTFADPTEMLAGVHSVDAQADSSPKCRTNPELFMPIDTITALGEVVMTVTRKALKEAQELCATCPQAQFKQCSREAENISTGIYAGVNQGARPSTRANQREKMIELRSQNQD